MRGRREGGSGGRKKLCGKGRKNGRKEGRKELWEEKKEGKKERLNVENYDMNKSRRKLKTEREKK